MSLTNGPLDQLAARIQTHLKRMEDDAERRVQTYVTWKGQERRIARFYHARSRRAGSRIAVCYVSFQHTAKLTRVQAEAYLAWLDAGNYGTHYEQQREATATQGD